MILISKLKEKGILNRYRPRSKFALFHVVWYGCLVGAEYRIAMQECKKLHNECKTEPPFGVALFICGLFVRFRS